MPRFDPYALHDYYVTCAKGAEKALANELRELGVRSVRAGTAGASCKMKIAEAYRVCLWSRVASRVLYSLREIPARDSGELYRWAKGVHWEDHIVGPESTIAVDVTGTSSSLRDTQFTAVRVKDAVCDRLREIWDDERPSVNAADPDVRINVVLLPNSNKAKISIDFAGNAMHRRGYRSITHHIQAPMKENLAAAMLIMSGWEDIAKKGGMLVDPMCGSGTLAIEAAMIAGDRAPGLMRSKWGFEGWKNHDEDVWVELLEEADNRAEAGLANIPRIVASDIDPEATKLAAENMKRAGVGSAIEVLTRDVSAVVNPDPDAKTPGLVVCNPPYGERLETLSQLPALYGAMGSMLYDQFAGWDVAIITPDAGVDEGLNMVCREKFRLFNGRIESPLRIYTVGEVPGAQIMVSLPDGSEQAIRVKDASALEFANRLKKMNAHWSKWARKSDISCYRVYDADLPAYNVVIDIYQTSEGRAAHVAEYAAPQEIGREVAQARLADILALTPLVLGIDRSRIFSKKRWRQRGTAQYIRSQTDERKERDIVETVSEGGLKFEVNLSDYLDTGLFLDQRITRDMIRKEAKGARFLNLFAYTGTASVYAADGGAFSTTTVDLSNTYLEWAQRNFNLNGFAAAFGKLLETQTATHELMRADVIEWIARERRTNHRYDLIFCDPPTFSNSTKMKDTWDVQRDHAELIIGFSRLLTREGHGYFSCNRKGFKLDEEMLLKYSVIAKEVTSQTVSPDFERSGGGHRIWRITYKRRAD